jgi:hypothetical protein
MQLNSDVNPSTRQSAGAAEPSNWWVLGAVEDDQLFMAPTPRYSFQGDCECPDDCLRDHENE